VGLHESAEMYLETIYVLSKRGTVRSVDVAEFMGYSKPSVSRAVSILKRDGLLVMEKDGTLTLTNDGKETAKKIFERHTLLTAFLESIGVSAETASDDACKIEHVISDETISAMKNFIEKNLGDK
jgi:Mn-dependent DtxR family transcriptional regulator